MLCLATRALALAPTPAHVPLAGLHLVVFGATHVRWEIPIITDFDVHPLNCSVLQWLVVWWMPKWRNMHECQHLLLQNWALHRSILPNTFVERIFAALIIKHYTPNLTQQFAIRHA